MGDGEKAGVGEGSSGGIVRKERAREDSEVEGLLEGLRRYATEILEEK